MRVMAASYNHSQLKVPLQTFIMTLRVNESFCWQEKGGAVNIMTGTAERDVWEWRKQEMKQTKMGEESEREMKIFSFARCITFWPYYFLSCTENLMFNYWKHSSSPSPAKQYPAYISSRHHLTDGNIKIWCRVEAVGAESWRARGEQVSWLLPSWKRETATCQKNTR